MGTSLFELPVTIGNVTLRNPFIVGSGPTVRISPRPPRLPRRTYRPW